MGKEPEKTAMKEEIFQLLIPENSFKAERFHVLCHELWDGALHYDATDLNQSIDRAAVRKEYAKGGYGIHRGYYSPSPLFDTVVGRCDRGQLQTRFSNRTTSYVYSFDSCGHIIRAEQVWRGKCHTSEFILNEDSFSIGLSYQSDDDALSNVTTELYRNGCMEQFLSISREPMGWWSAVCEQYCYAGDNLREMRQYFYSASFDTSEKRCAFQSMGFVPHKNDTEFEHLKGYQFQDFQMPNNLLSAFSSKRLFVDSVPSVIVLKKPKPICFAPSRVYWT